MTIDKLVQVEEIDFLKAINNEMRDYLAAYQSCLCVLNELEMYKNQGYTTKYYFDKKNQEYLFKTEKTKIGFK
jgi:hypothetical protein